MSEKPRILIIDDDETIRDAISAVLEENGYIADTVKERKRSYYRHPKPNSTI